MGMVFEKRWEIGGEHKKRKKMEIFVIRSIFDAI